MKTRKFNNQNFKKTSEKDKTNIIEQHKKHMEENSRYPINHQLKNRNKRKISHKEMLCIIAKTNKFNSNDILITFGNMGIFERYETGVTGVTYVLIRIYKNDAIRLMIEYYFIIFNIINLVIENPFIAQKIFAENRQELETKFSIILDEILEKEIYRLVDMEILKKLGKRKPENEKEALALATNIQQSIKKTFGENFTEGLAGLMVDDYLKEIEDILKKYYK